MDDLDAWVTVGDAAQTAIKLIVAAARRSRVIPDSPVRQPHSTRECGEDGAPARN